MSQYLQYETHAVDRHLYQHVKPAPPEPLHKIERPLDKSWRQGH